MGRNEIRLRTTTGSGRSQRHKNYSALMRRHNRYLKLKRIIYVLYLVVFIFLFILLFMVIRMRKTQSTKTPTQQEALLSTSSEQNLFPLQYPTKNYDQYAKA